MSRILIIDEEPGNRLILSSRFSEQGYEVAVADTGAKGLIEARNSGYELFLIDAGLKEGISASELCGRLKGNPATLSVPIVLFQNQTVTPEEMTRAYEAGCEAFVPKSAMPALDHVVRVLLGLRAERIELGKENRSLRERLEHITESAPAHDNDPSVPARDNGEHSMVLRELASGRPNGLLVVDSEGYVRQADRAACEVFGNRVEGGKLGSMAPSTGLEAFVRDARTEPREGFRFDLDARKGRGSHSYTAAVVPLVSGPGQEDPGLKVVLLMDVGKRRLAAEILRATERGFPIQQLGSLLEAARQEYGPHNLVGVGTEAQELRSRVVELAGKRMPVVVRGEEGTGKRRIARSVHYCGPWTGPLLELNCGGLSAEGLENEIFGYVKGAFPQAADDRSGLLHQAQDGTLFLYAVESLPIELQTRLLDVIRRGRFTRRGCKREEAVDVRLILASAAPLENGVREGRFSEELMQELGQGTIRLSPLDQHSVDVPVLVTHFLQRMGFARGVTAVSPQALGILESYSWPGNVTELEDAIEKACIGANDGIIQVEDLPRALQDVMADLPERELTPVARREGLSLQGTHSVGGGKPMGEGGGSQRTGWIPKELRPWDITDEDPISLEHYEKMVLLRALNEVEGDKLAAARLLNVGKSTLYRKLKRFGIT